MFTRIAFLTLSISLVLTYPAEVLRHTVEPCPDGDCYYVTPAPYFEDVNTKAPEVTVNDNKDEPNGSNPNDSEYPSYSETDIDSIDYGVNDDRDQYGDSNDENGKRTEEPCHDGDCDYVPPPDFDEADAKDVPGVDVNDNTGESIESNPNEDPLEPGADNSSNDNCPFCASGDDHGEAEGKKVEVVVGKYI